MTDYSNLTDREIDALIAERVCDEPRPAAPSEEAATRSYYSGRLTCSTENNWYISHAGEAHWEPIHFSASHDVCADVMEKLPVDRRAHFWQALEAGDMWSLLTVTPRQKCEALLRAMDANKKEV